jgi:hypothetical protein
MEINSNLSSVYYLAYRNNADNIRFFKWIRAIHIIISCHQLQSNLCNKQYQYPCSGNRYYEGSYNSPDYHTLLQSPLRIIDFRKCANSSFNFQKYLFERKLSTHFNRKLYSLRASVSASFSCLGDPNKIFRVSAMTADIFWMSPTAAITARMMCLKALITIS